MSVSLSFKRLQIDKTVRRIINILTLTAVVIVFTAIGSRQLLAKLQYQNRVISAKTAAKTQLQSNLAAVNSLVEAYQQFDRASVSVIGTAESNSTVILDALPSKYDFPALTTSLEKIFSLGGYSIEGITGSDQELTQASVSQPAAVEIPFTVSASSNYDNIQKLISDFDRSIRPMHILVLELSAGAQVIKATVSAKTYYQPEQKLLITSQEVR